MLCSAFRISGLWQGKCMYIFTCAWIHEKYKTALLKSCIFPLTIFFMRTSTHEHKRLERKAVGMKTTGRNWQHHTQHWGNSKFSIHLLCSLHSTQRFSPRFQFAGIKNGSTCEVRVISSPVCANFPTQNLFFHARPCEVFLESQLEGSQWSMHAELLPVPALTCSGLLAWAAQACPPTQSQKQNKLWKQAGNGVPATQWHNGKCCTEYGALLNKHSQCCRNVWKCASA